MSEAFGEDYRAYHAGAGRGLVPPAVSRAAGALLFLLLVAGMALWAYRLGTRDASEVPIIRAMEGPARVAPDDPGGAQAPHQGLEVNDLLAGGPLPEPVDPDAVVTAPPPLALAPEDAAQGALVRSLPEIPEVPAALRAGAGGGAAAEAEGEGRTALSLAEAEDDAAAAATGDAAEAAPAVDLGDEVAALIAAALEDRAAREAAAETPALTGALRPRVRPDDHARAAPAPTRAPAAAPAAPQPAAPAASAATAPAAAAPSREVASLAPGTRLVQLGAFDNEAMARHTWEQLAARHGDLLGDKSLYLERATHNARVFYRLRVAGFADSEATRVLCERLRGRGVDCIPVTLQ